MLSNREHQRALRRLEVLSEKALPPLARLEYGLHGIVTFGIMPLFALANAGVDLRGGGAAIGSTVGLGVILGLVLGKPVGITLASWLAVRAGVASLPAGIGWRTLAGTAVLGGNRLHDVAVHRVARVRRLRRRADVGEARHAGGVADRGRRRLADASLFTRARGTSCAGERAG